MDTRETGEESVFLAAAVGVIDSSPVVTDDSVNESCCQHICSFAVKIDAHGR